MHCKTLPMVWKVCARLHGEMSSPAVLFPRPITTIHDHKPRTGQAQPDCHGGLSLAPCPSPAVPRAVQELELPKSSPGTVHQYKLLPCPVHRPRQPPAPCSSQENVLWFGAAIKAAVRSASLQKRDAISMTVTLSDATWLKATHACVLT